MSSETWVTVDHSKKKNRKSGANLDETYTVHKKSSDNNKVSQQNGLKNQNGRVLRERTQQQTAQQSGSNKSKRSTTTQPVQNGQVKSNNNMKPQPPAGQKTPNKSIELATETKHKQSKIQQKSPNGKKSAVNDAKPKKAKNHSSSQKQKSMGARRIPLTLLSTVLVVALAIYLDYRQSGVFQKSYTGRTLRKYGVLDSAESLYISLNQYTQVARSWASKNLPDYYNPTVKFLSPYLITAREQFAVASAYLRKALLPVIQWFENTRPVVVKYFTTKVIPVIHTFVKDLNIAIQAFILQCTDWIQTNVLTGSFSPENLSRVSGDAVAKVQVATGDLVSWISRQVQAFSK